MTLMNDYSGSYNLMVVALFELTCLCYVYGKVVILLEFLYYLPSSLIADRFIALFLF